MGWERYNLDQAAHDLVLEFHKTEALNQAYKMRAAVAYGLERFWGEQLRLDGDKARFWQKTWEKLCNIMAIGGVTLPTIDANPEDLWNFPIEQRKVTLAILMQLCDSIVWWTQRYKGSSFNELEDDDE
ncbi:hypothetical protein [Planktothricoides raciborskii]|uniref:Uncharacterized protein n=1 Tax=Planktothricoides raciborskii GIHE-MW2 TaxID=2792601 RepID=A0AAU8JJT2_9CYAN